MYIPLFILLTELFLPVSVPLLMQGGYLGLYEYEKKLIAMDNANILIGRKERELFNWLAKMNQQLHHLDSLHHPVHACAHSPFSAFCGGAADKPMEEGLKAASNAILNLARIRWILIEVEARRELAKWGISSAILRRESSIPIQTESCPFCWLKIFFEVDKSKQPIRTHLSVLHGWDRLESHEELKGKTLNQASWNYRLWARSP